MNKLLVFAALVPFSLAGGGVAIPGIPAFPGTPNNPVTDVADAAFCAISNAGRNLCRLQTTDFNSAHVYNSAGS
jgi:hypothetical protein